MKKNKAIILIFSLTTLFASCGIHGDRSSKNSSTEETITLKTGKLKSDAGEVSSKLLFTKSTGQISFIFGQETFYMKDISVTPFGVTQFTLASEKSSAKLYDDPKHFLNSVSSSSYKPVNTHLLIDEKYFFGDLETLATLPPGTALQRDYEILVKFFSPISSIPSKIAGYIVDKKNSRPVILRRNIYLLTIRSNADLKKIIKDILSLETVKIAQANQQYHPHPRIGASN